MKIKISPPGPKPLTLKQSRFVLAYLRTGNGVESAKEAGYKGTYKTLDAMARDNLEKPRIIEELQRHGAKRDKPKIASMEEVLEVLTAELRASSDDARHTRIKAGQLLGKRYGGFINDLETKKKELELKQMEHSEAIAKLQREDAVRRYGSNVPLVEEGRFYPAGGPGVGPCARYHAALDPSIYPASPLLASLVPGAHCPLCGGLAPVAPMAAVVVLEEEDPEDDR